MAGKTTKAPARAAGKTASKRKDGKINVAIIGVGNCASSLVQGRYFYADFCTGLLRSFKWTRDGSSRIAPGWVREHWDWKAAIDKQGVLSQISSFGVDHDGELYIVLLTGSIYRLGPKG